MSGKNGDKNAGWFARKNSAGWMQAITDKYSKPGELVVELLSGTLATARACSGTCVTLLFHGPRS